MLKFTKLEPTDGDPFLAALDTRIAKLQAFRTAYLDVLASGGFGQGELDPTLMASGSGAVATSLRAPGASVDLPVGVFRDKTIPDAIKIFLAAMRRKQTVREIATGLKQGGLISNSTNWETTVTGSLHRLRDAGVVLRFPDGWDLAESYPEHIRKSATVEPKTKATKRAAKGRKSARPAAKTTAKASTKPAEAEHVSIDKRIAEFIDMTPDVMDFSPTEIGRAIGEANPKFVGLALGRMARYGKIERTADGRFRRLKAAG